MLVLNVLPQAARTAATVLAVAAVVGYLVAAYVQFFAGRRLVNVLLALLAIALAVGTWAIAAALAMTALRR